MSTTSTPISRRRFLKTGCITAAAIGMTLCGGGALVATAKPDIDFPTTTFGETTMNDRILIAYASKAGSTAEIAARMGEKLAQRGAAVDVLPVNQAGDLAAYQAVVLGSAIRIGSLLPDAMTFVKRNQAALQTKAFSTFIVCTTLEKDTPENRATASAYLEPLRALIKPASEGLFAGVVDLSKLPLFERLMSKAMKTSVGDFRDWDQIFAWADALPLSA